jgi:hypothetical protein
MRNKFVQSGYTISGYTIDNGIAGAYYKNKFKIPVIIFTEVSTINRELQTFMSAYKIN